MPAGSGSYLNDNIRTEHLKCSNCRTRTYLTKIERDEDGAEMRSFACPHCAAVTRLRLPVVADPTDMPLSDLGAS